MSDFDQAYAQHPTLKKEAKIVCKPPVVLCWFIRPSS
jgi:hypothetical protein